MRFMPSGLSLLGLAFVVALAPGARRRATGRVEGVATISNQITTPRLRVRVYDEPGTPPAKTAADTNPFANVVLWLEPAGNTAPLSAADGPAHPVTALRQHGEAFAPHVIAVVAGTRVEFPNDDPLYHNVFSLSNAKQFDLGRYAEGTTKSVTFSTPGIVQVFCHIHADMNGYVVVLDNPFFVVPDRAGRFSLDGIPAGDYHLIAWHERIKQLRLNVHVDAGRTTTLTLKIPLPDRPVKP